MPSHVIDYFATLGRRDGQLAIRSSNEQINLTPKDTWFEAITDLAVLIEGEEKLNSEWEVCDKSSGGLDLFPPHIAIKRRKYSKRLDHIVEIRLVQEGAVIPKEFELIRLSSSGKYSAYLNPIGFLAIRRGVNSNMQYIHGDWSIHKLEIVLYCEGEELKEDYHEVKTVLPVSNSNNHQNNHIVNNVVAIAVQKVKPIGFCDFTYEYATIDRYPIIDQKDAQLPVNELPMFGFPQGLRLHYGSNQQYPLPVFFTFVFTDYKGDHFYAECLRFYEQIDNSYVVKLFNDVYDVNINSIDDIDLFHENGLFCPKVICLISRRPFYRAMRRLLKQIYSLSLSSIPCPIEFFISSLINLIPLPVEGGRPFHIILDAALISSTSRSLAPIIFQQPHKAFFPLMDLDFSAPFKCLSVDNIVAVFALMLREAKIVFISQSNILLTETMETFRSLLFPLVWSSCFVSPLPDALSGMLEAPGGFMVGFHIAHDPADEKSNIEKQLNKGISLIDQQSWSYSLTPGTYVVDLSCNTLYQHNGENEEPISNQSLNELLKCLPLGPKKRLINKLSSITTKFSIKPNRYTYTYDNAFDFQPLNDLLSTKSFPTLEVRDAFLVFMIDILGTSILYIKPPSIDLLSNNFRTFKENFLIELYIESIDVNYKDLYIYLCETQMFAMYLQQRSEGKEINLIFFENAMNLLNQLNLSAIGYNNTTPPILPVPLYQLLYAEEHISRSVDTSIRTLNNSIDKNISPNKYVSPKRELNINNNKNYLQVLLNYINKQLDDSIDHEINTENELDNETIANEINDSRRYELDKYDDLDLYDSTKGPLVIPGPNLSNIKKLYHKINEIPNIYCTSDGRYIYRDGWPKLNQDLLSFGLESIHDRIHDITHDRVYTLENINDSIYKYVRTSSERLSFGIHGKLHHKANLLNHFNDEVTCTISYLLDISSISISMLTTRILYTMKPSNDILQILGILGQLDSYKLLHLLDQSIYRAILVSTSIYDRNIEESSSELMKRIGCLIYDIINEIYVNPDALSYGLYIQSLSKKPSKPKSSDSKLDNSYIDSFTYLEELGFEWFKHKNKSLLDRHIKSTQTEKKSSSRRISINRLRSRTPSDDKYISSSKKEDPLLKDIASLIGLSRDAGLLPFYELRNKNYLTIPKHISEYKDNDESVYNSVSDIVGDIKSRYNEIYKDIQSTDMELWIRGTDPHNITSSIPNALSPKHSPAPGITTSSSAGKSPVPHRDSGKKRMSIGFPDIMANKMLSAMDSTGSSMNQFIASNINGITSNMTVPTAVSSAVQTPMISPVQNKTQEVSPGVPLSSRISKLLSPFMSSAPTATGQASNNITPIPEVNNATPVPSSNEPKKNKRRSTRRRNTVRTLAMRESFSDEEGSEYDEDETNDDIESLDTEGKDIETDSKTNKSNEDSNKESIKPLSILSDLSLEDHIQTDNKKSFNFVDIQYKINDLLAIERQTHTQAIGIYNQNLCPQCQYVMLDSEILSIWCGFSLTKTTINMKEKYRDSYINKKKDMVSIHRINCPNCLFEQSPLLHIRVYNMINSQIDELKHSEDIPYISPYGLRYLMEETIQVIGEKIINNNLLYIYNPILYWNILYYMNRLNMPTGYLSQSLANQITDIDMKMFKINSIYHPFNINSPLVIGYQEHMVKTSINMLFNTNRSLQLVDIFPLLVHHKDIEIIENIASIIEYSLVGMRESIISISKLLLNNSLLSFNIKYLNRYIYLSLYSIAYFYNLTKLISPVVNDIPDGLMKGILFDSMYAEAINCILSPSDFEMLGCTRYELLAVIPTESMKAIHLAFGFIL